MQLQWPVPCCARGRGRGNSSPIGVGAARGKRSDAGADRRARRLAREPRVVRFPFRGSTRESNSRWV